MSATSERRPPPGEVIDFTKLESSVGAIAAFAWAPNGTLLATAHTDSFLRIWEQGPQGFFLRASCLVRATADIESIRWSPDSLKLALVFRSNDDLWVWTIANNSQQRPVLQGICAVAWSRDSKEMLAVLDGDRCLRWNIETNERKVVQSPFFSDVVALDLAPSEELFAMVSRSSPELRVWSSFSDMWSIQLDSPMTGLTWAPDGRTLAVFGNATTNIELISLQQSRRVGVLQGLLCQPLSCEFSHDGQLLVACGADGSVHVWRADTLELVALYTCPQPVSAGLTTPGFHPSWPLVTILMDDGRRLRLLSISSGDWRARLPATVRQVSAKVVLVGEARVGKTCLALRLAEDRYEEQDSTHGMGFWRLAPERLDPLMAVPVGERRDVVLWDLGGQQEYLLVHQLFLHDTTLALVLFDPLQGRAAFDEVEAWNKRFERQLHGREVVKLLVGTKQDKDTPVDRLGIDALVKRCGFAGYFPTSARKGRGIAELKAEIARALDWASMARTSRPDLFQRIQDEMEAQRSRGTVVLPMEELEQTLREQSPADFDPRAVSTVVEQLALQGVIALTRLRTGEPVMVLQLGEVERYAGSLLLAARDNPLGAPAIDQSLLPSRTWELPLIPREKRLPLREERLVLECVMQLFIEHGLCVQHAGLLVFPSLFRTTESQTTPFHPTVSTSYELAGAVDNIYSALVADMALSQRFGRMRLWEDRAEFESAGQGACGLRRVELGEGMARLDVYFDTKTDEHVRGLFTRYVEAHLRRAGVSPSASSTASPVQGGRSLSFEQEAEDLRGIIKEQKQHALNRTKRLFEEPERPSAPSKPVRILHLSDLHMRADSDVESLLQPLIADLRDGEEGLGLGSLDFLLISGDLTERATPAEFEQAQRFVSGLIEAFALTAQRCIIVPGNHDLSWDEENVYEFRMKRQVKPERLKPGHFTEKGDGYLLRNETHYPLRFRNFSKSFYHPLMQKEYPLEFQHQGLVSTFADSGLQVLAFNSAWEVDEHNPHRSGIHRGAVARALKEADKASREAQGGGKLIAERGLLRIAVWHHPVTGRELMSDDSFIELLRQAEVRLCLHGHVHEARADVMRYLHPSRRLHVIGAGSFGAMAHDRPEATPRMYNVLELQHPGNSVRVHTRCLYKSGGAWEGWAVWPAESSSERRTWYQFDL